MRGNWYTWDILFSRVTGVSQSPNKQVRDVLSRRIGDDESGKIWAGDRHGDAAVGLFGAGQRGLQAVETCGGSQQQRGACVERKRSGARTGAGERGHFARTEFLQGLRQSGGHPEPVGRPEDAAAALQKLVSIKPDYAEAYVPLGLFLEKLGKTEEAMAQYEKAAELFAILAQKKPKDSNPVINRAVALFLSNNKRQAVESLNAYLAQFPDEEYAKKVKAKIENTDRPSFVTSMEEQKSSQ
ncbi:MAG TPA: tetratricopeptide repeat protein [Candidatus Hydrogenedentes bacterium]|nr:tetratricopeptide repeat protein [Candidatus Hydrogenedentota bacterium]